MINALTFEEILKNMPMHYNFYVRGIFNAMTPDFMRPTDKAITEQNISGESVEFLRGLVYAMYPDIDSMPDGLVGSFGYNEVNKKYNLGNVFKKAGGFSVENLPEQYKMALGNITVVKENGRPVIKDTYDFPTPGNWKEFSDVVTPSDYAGAIKDRPDLGVYFGARFVAERVMGDDQDDNLRVSITLPEQPMTIDVDYDDDIPAGAEEMVLRGPMTNKRKELWDKFTSMLGEAATQLNPVSEAKADQLDADVVEYVEALGEGPLTPDMYKRYEARLAQSAGGVRVFDPAEMMGMTKGSTRQ